MTTSIPRLLARRARQRGVTTLIVALCLLVILTIIILASSNVALFEQKTTVNENRQMMANQSAEYGLNLAGEYLKANVVNIASNEDDDGWLTAGGSNLHWQLCDAEPADPDHPCMAEADEGRRQQLYYYTADGTEVDDADDALLDIPVNDLLADVELAEAGGTAAFPVTTRVHALLCRLDTTVGAIPTCQAEPAVGNRIAITLIADAELPDESAKAQIKESWGTYNNFSAQSAVPLVASGVVEGLGNATIVPNPNAVNKKNSGFPVSIWSPRDVDIDDGGGGVGSVQTCNLQDYLGDVPTSELQTTCASNGSTCGCDVDGSSNDFLSGGASDKIEGRDILDIDGQVGDRDLPDIPHFPGKKADGTCHDDATVDNDDNLFEWIFMEDVNLASTCAEPNTSDERVAMVAAEDEVLANLGATIEADCDGLNADSSGLIQVTGDCDLPNGSIGSPDNPVVLVINDDAHLNNTNIFGMLFIRDTDGVADEIQGNGNAKVFGSVVVEGDVNLAGSIEIIYVDTSAGSPGKKLPATTRFARLPGSWLDSRSGF